LSSFVEGVAEDPELVEGFVVVVLPPPVKETVRALVVVSGGTIVVGATVAGTVTNLSLLKTVKPAIGIVETFFSFTFSVVVDVGGVAEDPEPAEGRE